MMEILERSNLDSRRERTTTENSFQQFPFSFGLIVLFPFHRMPVWENAPWARLDLVRRLGASVRRHVLHQMRMCAGKLCMDRYVYTEAEYIMKSSSYATRNCNCLKQLVQFSLSALRVAHRAREIRDAVEHGQRTQIDLARQVRKDFPIEIGLQHVNCNFILGSVRSSLGRCTHCKRRHRAALRLFPFRFAFFVLLAVVARSRSLSQTRCNWKHIIARRSILVFQKINYLLLLIATKSQRSVWLFTECFNHKISISKCFLQFRWQNEQSGKRDEERRRQINCRERRSLRSRNVWMQKTMHEINFHRIELATGWREGERVNERNDRSALSVLFLDKWNSLKLTLQLLPRTMKGTKLDENNSNESRHVCRSCACQFLFILFAAAPFAWNRKRNRNDLRNAPTNENN